MDIVKALTIRIGADVYPFTTAIVAAGEAMVWLTGKMKDLANYTKEGLITGGALAESTAGLSRLAQQYGQTSDEVLKAFDKVTDGQMGLMEMTQRTTKALQMGYSPEQTAIIWEFARKYTDAVGGSMEAVAEKIETSIVKGRTKTLAEFGIMAKSGEEAFDQLIKKTEELGDGAFNFGDSFKQITNSIEDMSLAVWEQLNNIVGSKGFAGVAESIRAMFWDLKGEAGNLAAGIYAIAETLITPLYSMFRDFFMFLTGDLIKNTDTWRETIYKLSKFAISSVYDIEAVIMGAISAMTLPVVKFAELNAKLISMLTPGKISEFYGAWGENLNQFANVQSLILDRKQQQLQNFDASYAAALAATNANNGMSQIPNFAGGYTGNQIQSPTTGPAETAQKAQQAVGGAGSQIVINVPKSDKLGEAFRDWLTVDAISEGTMRAGI